MLDINLEKDIEDFHDKLDNSKEVQLNGPVDGFINGIFFKFKKKKWKIKLMQFIKNPP